MTPTASLSFRGSSIARHVTAGLQEKWARCVATCAANAACSSVSTCAATVLSVSVGVSCHAQDLLPHRMQAPETPAAAVDFSMSHFIRCVHVHKPRVTLPAWLAPAQVDQGLRAHQVVGVPHQLTVASQQHLVRAYTSGRLVRHHPAGPRVLPLAVHDNGRNAGDPHPVQACKLAFPTESHSQCIAGQSS